MVAHKLRLLLIIFTLCSLSCARTVTDRSTPLFLEIKFTTREPINTFQNNYFIIFSKSPTPVIALPIVNPGSEKYFPTPGRLFNTDDPTFSQIFDSEGITPFYKDYFSTWSDYIVIHNNTFLLYNSQSTGFNSSTTDNNFYSYNRNRYDGSLSFGSNTITFTIDASAIYPSLTGTAYFTLATSKIIDGSETGYFRDKIDVQASIPIKINSKNGPNSEIENSGLDGSNDIISWEVRLF